MGRVIALVTDFGTKDPYVGQMKGVLANMAPGCPVVDIAHDIEPFHIDQAGFYVEASRIHFPPGTVFVAVVDPGVGTDRRVVCVEAHRQLFLAPDNGLLSLVVRSAMERWGEDAVRAYDMSAKPDAPDVSATFHGRDVFAPAASRLAMGEAPESLGTALDPAGLLAAAWSEPEKDKKHILARVLHVDRFGNVLLNLARAAWEEPLAALAGPKRTLAVQGGQTITARLAHAYAELPLNALGLLAGSQGFWELALNMGSAAEALCVRVGDSLRIGPATD